jgi:adenine phosphoribosyltransferase
LHLSGGSAKAAGELVAKAGGQTVEYIFVIRLNFLKGWEKLDAPAYAIIESDD